MRWEPGSSGLGDLGDREFEVDMERCFLFRDFFIRGVSDPFRLEKWVSRSLEGMGDRERDLFVDMVETELDESRDLERDLPRGLRDRSRMADSSVQFSFLLASDSANCWSATPLLSMY